MKFPKHLDERVRELKPQSSRSDGKFVLYWMHHAMRADENAALDVARIIAAERKLPLLVYQELRSDECYASDRHHTFALEGARDVQQQLQQADISYALYLGLGGAADSYLKEVATKAAVIVTEDYPIEPIRSQLNDLVDGVNVGVLAVDTSCVVPMQLVERGFERAFQYRRHAKKLYEQRVGREWPECPYHPEAFPLDSLPFETRQLAEVNIAETVSQCPIDHSVGAVCDTVGGTDAGYARWNQFKSKGLSAYGRKRNDPLKMGVSRMSAYLHYGMVSPMRLARESQQHGSDGAEKYLDELLIWRELAFNYCFHRDDYDQFTTLPVWAHETLRNHADDLRSQRLSWEEMVRAKSGDSLWDAAQRSLLVQGELHNNVRMTWGKALLQWTDSPEVALQRLIDLNHRFALDGRDPASYGGILWCLGQFDRPFFPEQFVIGTVRPRLTWEHAKRLDVEQYRETCSTLRVQRKPKIAVIGAGIAGLFAARSLRDHGADVVVFEKSRGVGGRMATRRSDGWHFDHGAQYFTIRDRRLENYVSAWSEQGLIEAWEAPVVHLDSSGQIARDQQASEDRRWIPCPAMNSLCKHLATELEVIVQTRIDRVIRHDGNGSRRLQLIDDHDREQGDFDYVVVTAPAGQAAQILREFPDVAAPISEIAMSPCWAALIAFDQPLNLDWGGAFINDKMLAWASRGSSRPLRDKQHETLVLHATPEWTSEHLELPKEEVAKILLERFMQIAGQKLVAPVDQQAHRWMYARAADRDGSPIFFDAESGVAACGDWTNGERVEAALLSGMAAVGRLMGDIAATEKRVDEAKASEAEKEIAQPT